MNVLVHGDVKEGLELEPLSYDVSSTTVVLGALATRDWRPHGTEIRFSWQRSQSIESSRSRYSPVITDRAKEISG